jgi:mRNA-degrading endonuclease RelE of RelBE toxin-antitoxin system
LIAAADKLKVFPYANAVYLPLRALRYEYRKALVRNYVMFYCVDEGKKLVTMLRVVYAGRDYDELFF